MFSSRKQQTKHFNMYVCLWSVTIPLAGSGSGKATAVTEGEVCVYTRCTLDAAVVKALQMLVAHIIAFRVQCLLIKTTADAAVQENGSVISIVLKVVPEFCVVQPGNL
ncbi:uncharacterized [Tachysurus ichikawai]